MKPTAAVADAEFEARVGPYRAELHAYCYRMLGSLQDAEDALQETLVGAWRGLAGFEGRSALRSWLYRIATNACLRLAAQRPRRLLAADHAPPCDGVEVEPFVEGPIWIEPYPHDAGASFELLETVELAFVAESLDPGALIAEGDGLALNTHGRSSYSARFGRGLVEHQARFCNVRVDAQASGGRLSALSTSFVAAAKS